MKKWKLSVTASIIATMLLSACGSDEEAGGSGDSEKKYEIGITQYVEHPSLDEATKGFKQALKDKGLEVEYNEQSAQGDANNTPDDPILIGQIKGEVVGSIPLVGYLVNLIKNPISVILIIGLMFYVLEKSYSKDKEEKEKDLEAIKEEIRKLKEELYQ